MEVSGLRGLYKTGMQLPAVTAFLEIMSIRRQIMFKILVGSIIAGASALVAYEVNKRLKNGPNERKASMGGELKALHNDNRKLEPAPSLSFGFVDE